MEYEIKITGSGTIEQIYQSLDNIRDSIHEDYNRFRKGQVDSGTAAYYEDPTLCVTIETLTEEE